MAIGTPKIEGGLAMNACSGSQAAVGGDNSLANIVWADFYEAAFPRKLQETHGNILIRTGSTEVIMFGSRRLLHCELSLLPALHPDYPCSSDSVA